MEAAASDDGSGAGRRRVSVAIRQAERETRIEVANTGPAIPDDVARRMWDHGFTTKPDGHGIGLALVKDRVEAAGGSIWYERETGLTVFYIVLPVEDEYEHS